MAQPLVSVIIPTYNRCKELRVALDSVISQTYQNIEIIVVDDGSTDNTREVVSSYTDVKYLVQNNNGPSAARNTGIKNSHGELIAFLDSDDAWLPHKLEKQVRCFVERPELGIVGTGCFNCDENLANPTARSNLKLAKSDREQILIWNYWPTPSLCIRRICFDTVGFFDEEMKFAEDWDMWIRIAQSFQSFTIKEPLILIRKHQQSLSGSAANRDYNYDLWEKLIIKNKERYSMGFITFHKAMSYYYFNRSYGCQVSGDGRGEQHYLLQSLIHWPFYYPKRSLAYLLKLLKSPK